MLKPLLLGAALIGLLAGPAGPAGAAADPLREEAKQHFAPIAAKPPAIKDNPATAEKVELGEMLFFEPRLSASHLFSCNSCHNVATGGVDGLETSIGHGWAAGPRNAPTVLNAVNNVAQFWDGRAVDLKAQAKGPIQAAVEMNSTPERVLAVLNSMPEYKAKFAQAFPKEKDPVSFDNVARAIEVYEATLVTPDAPFDQWLKGKDSTLTAQQKQGVALFMEKGCAACHNGINVGGQDYFPFGVVEKPGAEVLPAADRGRFQVTQTADDDYVFRSPTLRNVALTAPYFHSGKVWDLRQAVAIMGTSQLGTELAEPEVEAITAFLHSLTGAQPKVELPILPASTAETPKPVSR